MKMGRDVLLTKTNDAIPVAEAVGFRPRQSVPLYIRHNYGNTLSHQTCPLKGNSSVELDTTLLFYVQSCEN